jgi:hypothetical protein
VFTAGFELTLRRLLHLALFAQWHQLAASDRVRGGFAALGLEAGAEL